MPLKRHICKTRSVVLHRHLQWVTMIMPEVPCARLRNSLQVVRRSPRMRGQTDGPGPAGQADWPTSRPRARLNANPQSHPSDTFHYRVKHANGRLGRRPFQGFQKDLCACVRTHPSMAVQHQIQGAESKRLMHQCDVLRKCPRLIPC